MPKNILKRDELEWLNLANRIDVPEDVSDNLLAAQIPVRSATVPTGVGKARPPARGGRVAPSALPWLNHEAIRVGSQLVMNCSAMMPVM